MAVETPENNPPCCFCDLPDDLLAEILSRLLVKTLCSLRCVCKKLYNFVSNPNFQNLHHQKSKKTPMLFYLDQSFIKRGSTRINSCKLRGMNLDGDLTYDTSLYAGDQISSCDMFEIVPSYSNTDLICLASSNTFYLCNPSIHQLVQLPDVVPSLYCYDDMRGGFGYSPTSDEYVVIHLTFDVSSIASCEVLSFSNKTIGAIDFAWRKFDDKLLPYYQFAEEWGILVDRIFYWRVLNEEFFECIISFDLDEEKFRMVPPHPTACFTTNSEGIDHDKSLSLIDLKGQLCLVDPSHVAQDQTVEIYMLMIDEKKKNETSSSWTKLFSFPLQGFNFKVQNFVPLGDVDGDGDGDGGFLFYITNGYQVEDSSEEEEDEEPYLDYFLSRDFVRSVWFHDRQNNHFRKFEKDLNLKVASKLNMISYLCLHTDNFFKIRNT
ncbi:hypothetical protein ACH5RR_007626 [Cinchona calisaya]|uniref:F-box domain-containing protein n=1 Tax=Cinchona calisaya TaxID=153742 RepID=A0ABD3AAQ1_9GENT